MKKLRLFVFILQVLLLALLPRVGAADSVSRLAAPPIGERWFVISMNGDKTGFACSRISATAAGYEITGEGSASMRVLGFSRDASASERYIVNRDLSLKSFSVEQVIDKSPLNLHGEVTANGVKVTVETRGSGKERFLKTKGPVYPPSALNIYPLMRGAVAGKTYRLWMLDVEAVKVREVNIRVVGMELLADGQSALHLQNDLYPFVENDIWVDLEGNTLRESVRSGLIITQAEDEQTARSFLFEAALSRKDMVLDFSLVRVTTPISKPRMLKRMVAEMTGVPPTFPLLEGESQGAERLADGRVRFSVTSRLPQEQPGDVRLSPDEADIYLRPTDRLPADNAELLTQKNEILKGEAEPFKVVDKLTRWVAASIGEAVTDSQSPLETLAVGRGNCQSHARLYASLARAAGVPSRIVSGLVYMDGQGFLYHSWAESHLKSGWVAVDPTFGQVPIDATHLKLVEGDSPADMAPLGGVVGRIKIRILDQIY
ncbi:MAG: transglutaminase domain-containing protein [Geobacteraceae bacterium]